MPCQLVSVCCIVGAGRVTDVFVGGMPGSKMKVRVEPFGFLKDQSTLAQLNIAPNTVIAVSAKERGGRGKK